jgi:hypothetical protein
MLVLRVLLVPAEQSHTYIHAEARLILVTEVAGAEGGLK